MGDVTFSDLDRVNRARREIFHCPPHLMPIYRAALDGALGLYVLFASDRGVGIDCSRAGVVMVFDADDRGVGPDGFDAEALEQLLGISRGVAVISHYGADPYVWASNAAVTAGGIIMLVETSAEFEQAWLDRVKDCRSPENWSLWTSPIAGRA